MNCCWGKKKKLIRLESSLTAVSAEFMLKICFLRTDACQALRPRGNRNRKCNFRRGAESGMFIAIKELELHPIDFKEEFPAGAFELGQDIVQVEPLRTSGRAQLVEE